MKPTRSKETDGSYRSLSWFADWTRGKEDDASINIKNDPYSAPAQSQEELLGNISESRWLNLDDSERLGNAKDGSYNSASWLIGRTRQEERTMTIKTLEMQNVMYRQDIPRFMNPPYQKDVLENVCESRLFTLGSEEMDRRESLELTPLSSKWGILFDRFDTDKDGRIPVYEFRNTIQEQMQNQVPLEVLRKLIRDADENQDGYINRHEFINLAQSNLGRKIMGELWLRWYMRKVVGAKAMRNMYRARDPDTIDSEYDYQEQMRWCPPPLSMLTASIVQVTIFLTTYDGLKSLLTNPVSTELVYNPYRRIEAWRFLTYMLIHNGWEHLGMNVFIQLALGIPLELVHRWWRVMLIYLVGIIAGSLGTSIVDPKTFLCGASGGVYALMLAHIATIILNWSEMEHPAIWLAFFTILMTVDTGNAIYTRYFTNIDTKVGYAAHFFGALTGLLFGLFVLRNLEKLKWENRLRIAAIVIFLLLFGTAIVWNIFLPEYFPPQQIN